jgi:hypothetical protein
VYFLAPDHAIDGMQGLAGAEGENSNLKTIFGYLLCFFIFIFLTTVKYDNASLVKCVNFCITFHFFFLILQLVVYYVSGRILELNPSGDARLTSEIFRPAGLFLEPAHAAICFFTMVVIRYLIVRKIDKYFLVGIVGILLSLSLWGVLAVMVLLAYHIVFQADRLSKIRAVLISLVVIPAIVVFIVNNETVSFIIQYSLIDRVQSVQDLSDASTTQRTGLPVNFGEFSYYSVLGHGFTNSTGGGGNNMFSLIFSNFGYIGFALFIMIFFLLRKFKNILLALLCFLLLLLGTNGIFSTFYFWFFLAFVFNNNRMIYKFKF